MNDTFSSGFILMNKLYDLKRYGDVLKVYNHAFSFVKLLDNPGQLMTDMVKLAAEANLENVKH